MKTTVTVLTLFAALLIACYMADKTGHFGFGIVQVAAIFALGWTLVKRLKLV